MSRNDIFKTEDDIKDNSASRPRNFDDFIGKSDIKDNLRVYIKSALHRQDVLDHILVYGPPGLGKTSIAYAISGEMKAPLKVTSGAVLSKAGELAALLVNLNKGDILFIDEIHRIPINLEEVLYTALENYKIDLIIGEGSSSRSVEIKIKPFTLIGATTKQGSLSKPLLDRFGINLHFDFYTPQELITLIKFYSEKLGLKIEEDALMQISTRSRGTPRIALRILRRLRDFAIHLSNNNVIDSKTALIAFSQLDIAENGLDTLDKKYIRFIYSCNNGPVGLDTISAGISETKDTIEDIIEPYLLQQGYILRTPRGRVITPKAISLHS